MSGGFFGKGIGEGTLKNRVPEAHTDYNFSHFRRIWSNSNNVNINVVFNFYFFSFKKGKKETDNKIKLILVGSVSLILLQAMIHIG